MRGLLRRCCGFVALAGVACTAFAQNRSDEWVVGDFRVEGNQSIQDGTVFTYLPINVGDTIDAQRVREAIRALYDTEFFQDIEFRRDGDTLVIAVFERPTIAEFTFDGNKDFKDEDLEGMLQETDLSAGKMFDRSMLDELTQFLTDEYYSRGKYAANIDASVEDLPDNRVRVHIEIEEGDRAKIREINIVGNTVFDDDELLDQFELTTGNLLSKFKKDNLYDKETLQGDLETLRSYYMDRGYADFQVSDVQVSISPDKTDIFISISVEEGDVYTIRSVDLAGNLVLPEPAMRLLVYPQPGQEFSQQLITFTEEDIKLRLGRDGYAFAEVQTVPELDRESKEVDLTIFVEPRNRVYVRRINFTGAENANDEVFRREVRQLEGGILSNELLDLSQQRLRRLAYVEEVEYETNEVIGSLDLVDVEFEITEGLPGSMSGNIGYSDSQGIILGGDFSHSNFLGTGNRVAFGVNGGKYYKVYSASFTEPYRNMDGLSRQVNLTYQDITQFSSVTSDFSTKTIAAGMTWGLPVSEVQTLQLGWQYQEAELLMSPFSSIQAQNWVRNNGEPFQVSPTSSYFGTKIGSVDIVAGWIFDQRNRTLFPDLGMRTSLNLQATLPGSDVEYFVAAYNVEKYFRMPGRWRFRVNTELNFGDAMGEETTALPPYRNFFGGGPNSVRGFKENYLGPRDSFGNPNGGNLSFANQLEIIIPTPDKFGNGARMAMFFDMGNVFHTGGVDFYDRLGDTLDTSFDYDKLKRSYGFGVEWLSPM
ncbi:MAG: outer membrane protein assembly factor BamA, partial [Gammaproteobacteria bacterium]